MAKKKPQWGRVYSPTATKTEKEDISKQFEPIIEKLKQKLQPIPEPQVGNHCVDVFSKWRGNFFYIMQKYKTGENAITDFFEMGLVRLEYYGKDKFNLSYFRHTGKWEPLPMYHDISFDNAAKAILEDPFFNIF